MEDKSQQQDELVQKFNPELVKGPYTLFVSDVHLSAHEPRTGHLFLHFLQHVASRADALYILGDLFDLWLGDDQDNEGGSKAIFHRSIALGLRNLVDQGKPVYIMRGNHDFLLGARFLEETGCQLIQDPTVIDLYGDPVLLTHGDRLCTLDPTHLRFRSIVQSRFVCRLFLMLPIALRQKIAAAIRTKSREHVEESPEQILDIPQSAVEAAMRQAKATRFNPRSYSPCSSTYL